MVKFRSSFPMFHAICQQILDAFYVQSRHENSSCFNRLLLFLNQILYIHTNILIAETLTSLSQTRFLPRLLRLPAVYKQKIQLYESNYLDTLIKCKIFTKYNT